MELPIVKERDRIIDAVIDNPVVVVVGETGSGKTTQIPIFLYEVGFAENGIIGITEPRRIAATSTAKYVAGQIGSSLGDLVGYQVRFDDETTVGTALKFMTDGILLREFQIDPELSRYSVVVIDEAHERSQNIDFILGLLKDLLKRRNDLKVIVASATIDEHKFSNFFDGAPIINVSGRMFPVEVTWSDEDVDEKTVVDATIKKIADIHRNEPEGVILAFMMGEDHIRKVIDSLGEMNLGDLVAVPAYASLPWEEQQKIFATYPGKRKVVVATNIAETSITIEGLVYVVNGGLIKQKNFHPESGIESLDVVEHSQSGCKQREGRAGRTQPGKCWHLFTEENFNTRPKFTEPEILRSSLAGVVLAMKDIGIDDVESFELVDPPSREAFHEAHETLIALGAIQRKSRGLTDIGKMMARLPLEPRIARMLIEADKYGCTKDVATVAAFLSGRNIYRIPSNEDEKYKAYAAHATFNYATSDALTFLNIWDSYEDSDFDYRWCQDNYLNARALREVGEIRWQLCNILESYGFKLTESNNADVVAKAVAMGLAYNLMEHRSRHAYGGVLRPIENIFIHPGSAIFNSANPRWMVVTEIVRTKKTYARGCTEVKPKWLPDIAPQYFKWGNPIVAKYVEGEDKALISRSILDKTGREVETSEKSVSIAEAMEIQNTRVREAETSGLLKLTFRKDESGSYSFMTRFVAEAGGKKYKTSSFAKVEEGILYYCKVVDTFLGQTTVEPVFRLFAFNDPLSPIGKSPAHLEQLAQKWGGSLKG